MTQKALKFRKILLKQSKLIVLPMPQEDKHFANTLNNSEIELASRWWTPQHYHLLNQFTKKSITNLPQKLFLWTMKNQLVLIMPVQTWPSSTTCFIFQHTKLSRKTFAIRLHGERNSKPTDVISNWMLTWMLLTTSKRPSIQLFITTFSV